MRRAGVIGLLLSLALSGGGLASAQDSLRVEILYAEIMRPLERNGQVIHRLLGKVALAHNEAVMHCDSAYVYAEENSFDAFGRVSILNRSMRITGDSLTYDGDRGQGMMMGRLVKMRDSVERVTLYSDRVLFDTETNSARYDSWGHIYTQGNDLRSRRGYYDGITHNASTAGDAVYRSDDGVVGLSDSVNYHRDEQRAYFLAPTRLYRDSSIASFEQGWYDRGTNQGQFEGNVVLEEKGYRLFSDRLHIDRVTSYADANGRVVVEDSLSVHRVYSQRVRYWDSPRRLNADQQPMVWSVDTSSSTRDTLYARADRFSLWQQVQTGPGGAGDTINYGRAETAFRLYRHDLQMVGDTAYYHGLDSTITIWREPYPYLWNEESQISSRLITAFHSASLDSIHFEDKVLVGSRNDSIHFDQITGQQMWAHLRENEVHRIDVTGDGEVIMFMEENERISAVNRIKSPRMVVQVRERKPITVTFHENPTSLILPIQDAQREDMWIYGFEWRDDLRPKSPQDIQPSWLHDLNFYTGRRELHFRQVARDSPRLQAPAPERAFMSKEEAQQAEREQAQDQVEATQQPSAPPVGREHAPSR